METFQGGQKRKLQCVITFGQSYKINGSKRIQDGQCTYNETLRRVRAIVAAEEKQYSERVFVNLDVQHALRMRQFVVFGLLGCTVFFHFTSYTAKLSKEKKITEHRMS
jgi:hypothetical protein